MQTSDAMRREIAKLYPTVIASEAIHAPAQRKNGLLRFARNDADRPQRPGYSVFAGHDGLPCSCNLGSLRPTRTEDAEPTKNNQRQHRGN
ncbi:hypothetical protein V1294_000691 [Bradyrhizobium sp. AZCC 1678]